MTVACPECGATQTITLLPRRAIAECYRCDTSLERTAGRSAGIVLALSAGALALYFPGNVLPGMRSELLGSAVEARPIDGVRVFYQDGHPLLAAMVMVFVLLIPILRAGFLVAVLGALRMGYHQPWQGRAFRLAEAMRIWAMAQVYVIAGVVTYVRVVSNMDIEVLPGGWCFVAAAVLQMVANASLDRRRIWTAIKPDEPVAPGTETLGCVTCCMALPIERAGEPCPRCARRLRVRKPSAVERTVALTIAALVLIYPAYFLPVIVSVQPDGVVERTLFDGVRELFARGFWYFGLILFIVSIAVPVVKIAALIWLALGVRFPHRRMLRARTRVHRLVDEINNSSFLDTYIVALNAAMLDYPGIADVRTGPAALPLALIVVLTMVASRSFDARLMWDAAGRKS